MRKKTILLENVSENEKLSEENRKFNRKITDLNTKTNQAAVYDKNKPIGDMYMSRYSKSHNNSALVSPKNSKKEGKNNIDALNN